MKSFPHRTLRGMEMFSKRRSQKTTVSRVSKLNGWANNRLNESGQKAATSSPIPSLQRTVFDLKSLAYSAIHRGTFSHTLRQEPFIEFQCSTHRLAPAVALASDRGATSKAHLRTTSDRPDEAVIWASRSCNQSALTSSLFIRPLHRHFPIPTAHP